MAVQALSPTKTRAVRSPGQMWMTIGRYTLLCLLAVIFLFPILFMLVSSLKPDAQLLQVALCV